MKRIALALLVFACLACSACERMKCEAKYDICMAKCDSGILCTAGCKAERQLCNL